MRRTRAPGDAPGAASVLVPRLGHGGRGGYLLGRAMSCYRTPYGLSVFRVRPTMTIACVITRPIRPVAFDDRCRNWGGGPYGYR